MLMEHQAVEIYMRKLSINALAEPNEAKIRHAVLLLRRECESLAKCYGLTPRAINDIWNRRSWAYATHHLWAQEQDGTSQRRYSEISAAQVMNS